MLWLSAVIIWKFMLAFKGLWFTTPKIKSSNGFENFLEQNFINLTFILQFKEMGPALLSLTHIMHHKLNDRQVKEWKQKMNEE